MINWFRKQWQRVTQFFKSRTSESTQQHWRFFVNLLQVVIVVFFVVTKLDIHLHIVFFYLCIFIVILHVISVLWSLPYVDHDDPRESRYAFEELQRKLQKKLEAEPVGGATPETIAKDELEKTKHILFARIRSKRKLPSNSERSKEWKNLSGISLLQAIELFGTEKAAWTRAEVEAYLTIKRELLKAQEEQNRLLKEHAEALNTYKYWIIWFMWFQGALVVLIFFFWT